MRLILMPLTWHNDTVWMPWMAFRIVEGHWNVYQYLLNTYGDRTLHPVVWAPYLPLYYLVTAAWTGALKVLGVIDVGQWSFDSTQWYIARFHRSLFFAKAIYLPFDLLLGWSMTRLVPVQRRTICWVAWAFTPISLVTTYMMGQNDVMPASLVALATLLGFQSCSETDSASSKHRWQFDLAAVVLGLAAAFKYYPLLLVLPYGLVLTRDLRGTSRFVVLSALPFALCVAPFLGSPAFRAGVLLNPESQNPFATIAGIGPFGLSPFAVGYSVLLAFLIYRRSLPLPTPTPAAVGLATLGLLFAVTSWPFNWFVWLLPFLIWSLGAHPRTSWYVGAYGVVFLIWTWNWGPLMSTELFSAALPGLGGVSAVKDLVNLVYPWTRIVALNQSALFGLLAVHLGLVFTDRGTSDQVVWPGAIAIQSVLPLAVWIAVSFLPVWLRG